VTSLNVEIEVEIKI